MRQPNVTTFYTITVDTEEEWDWSSDFMTNSNSVRNISALPEFQSVCDEMGAKVTYFVNHSVLADDSASQVILNLAEKDSVEIGLHIHPWNTPPLAANETVSTRDSFLHNLPQQNACDKLDAVFEAFRRHNLQPTSYRGGRYSTSHWIQAYLHANQIIADASILPFTTWSDDGAPDFRNRDLTPMRRTFREAPGAIWEIPLTLAFTRRPWNLWSKLFEYGERTPFRQLKLNAIAERLLVKRVWLNLENPMGEFSTALLRSIRHTSTPCINFTLHSSSVVPGLNSYTKDAAALKRLYDRLKKVVTLLNSWDEFVPATVSEVAQSLEASYLARTGN